jgi:hypothetical protein
MQSPPMPQYATPPAPKIKSYLAQSIIVTLFCCVLLEFGTRG